MPNCVEFVRKDTGKPEPFAAIDDRLCSYLGVTPDPVRFYRGWYDTIAYAAATGSTFERMIERYLQVANGPNGRPDPETLVILEWLETNYTVNAWYMPH